MEAQIVVALIGFGSAIGGVIVGYLVRSISGEVRAGVRNQLAQAKKNEADADSEYAELARGAARDLKELRLEYEQDKACKEAELAELRSRVAKLEQENSDKDHKIMALEKENAQKEEKIRALELTAGKRRGKRADRGPG